MKNINLLFRRKIAISLILINLSAIFFGLVSFLDRTLSLYAAIIDTEESQAPQYQPGEIIVKFRENIDTEFILERLHLKPKGIQRAYPIEPIVSNFKKEQKIEKDSDNWYWFLGKNYKEIKDIPDEELFKQAYQNMPPEEQSLYRTFKISLPEGATVEEAVSILKMSPYVEYAEPNYIVKVQMFPNDPYYSSSSSWGQNYDDLWGIKKLQCEQAWNISQGEGVVIAVIDTGVDYTHPDLRDNIWINSDETPDNNIDDDQNGYIDDYYGYDFSSNISDPIDRYGHGTHIAGTIAAVGNNSQGVIGVAPQAKIMAVKGLDDTGYGDNANLAQAVKYAADNGARVLNNSWGGVGTSQLLTDTFHYANSRDCVAIAGAGNSNSDVLSISPANIDTVIAVSSSTQRDEKCSFSNWGTKIEVSAPGGGYENELGTGAYDIFNILSTMPDNSAIAGSAPNLKVSPGYWRLAGTSMACPHVSGVAALILGRNPDLTADMVRQILQVSTDDIGQPGKDIYFGYGRVNAYLATSLIISVSISSPVSQSYIRGATNILGSTLLEEGFQGYELYFAPKENPQNTTLINSSIIPVDNGLLGIWNTTQAQDGIYILTLKVIAVGREIKRYIEVIVDNYNQPPIFSLTDKVAVIGRLLEFKVEAKDPDDPSIPWGNLVYSVDNLPHSAKFDLQTQIFSWQPSESEKDIYEVIFTVSDSENTTTSKITFVTLCIEETRITNSASYQFCPVIYKDKIAWADYRHYIYPENTNCDIYMYDLTTGQETQITTDLSWQTFPAIYGDKIVWNDYRTPSGIYMYDFSIGQETHIINERSLETPSIYQDRIVWESFRSGNCDIYMYDLATGQETQITTDLSWQIFPAIYGDKIVWEDFRNGNADIYMYDFATGKETQITTDFQDQRLPYIYKDKIVWMDNRNSYQGDIYMYDLSIGQETRITYSKHLVHRFYPTIYQDNIIWEEEFQDGSFLSSHIYAYNLSIRSEFQITNDNNSWQSRPNIYEDKIVWQKQWSNRWPTIYDHGIYMSKLIFAPQIISVSPTVVLPGALINITGNNFGYSQGDDSKVEFANGALAQIETWSNESIVCKVPQNAQTGLLKVITQGGSSNGVMVTIAIPDLIPTDIICNLNDLIEGNIIFFDSGIRNDGERSCGVFNIRWKVDGRDVNPPAYGSHSDIPGKTTVLDGNSQFSWKAIAGRHQIAFIVDSDNHISESNENNNIIIKLINVQHKGVVPLLGRVYDIKKRNPLSGARITLQQGQKIIQTAITDYRGNYSFKPIPSGTYDVLVTKIGYQSKRQRIILKNSPINNINFYLTSLPWFRY